MFIDALGREVWVSDPPQRVVSLSPSLTECLLALGAAPRLVGMTDFCEAGDHAEIVRVGGSRNPDLALIRSLRPDLVLASRDENDIRELIQLESDHIPVFVTGMRTVEGTLAQLGMLARMLDITEQATTLLDELQTVIDQAEEHRLTRRTRRVLMFTWANPWMAVGGETFASDLLRLCGAENLALRLPGRAPRADLLAFVRHNPEIILLATGGYDFTSEHVAAFRRFGDVAAVLRRRIHFCDGTLLMHGGIRTAEAIRVVSGLLHG